MSGVSLKVESLGRSSRVSGRSGWNGNRYGGRVGGGNDLEGIEKQEELKNQEPEINTTGEVVSLDNFRDKND